MAELSIFRLERRIGELRRQLAERDGRLGQSVAGELSEICSAIVDMEKFAKGADEKREKDRKVGEWVKMVMDAAHHGEDLVDGYLARAKMAESRDLSTAGTIAPRFTTTITRGRRVIARRFLKRRLPAFSQEVERVLFEIRHLGSVREEADIQQLESVPEEADIQQLESVPEEADIPLLESVPRREADGRFGATPVFTDFSEVVGIRQDAEEMKRWLLEGNAGSERITIFVTGMGGIGKTTLAAMVYNDTRNYFDCCAWANVSRDFETRSVLEGILKGFYASSSEIASAHLSGLDEPQLLERISSYMRGKKYLLVLDDVWDSQLWNKLKHKLPVERGAIIFTTRRSSLSESIDGRRHTLALNPLSEHDALNLFFASALPSRGFRDDNRIEELEPIAREIVKATGGLPLAIRVIGFALSAREPTLDFWKRVLKQLGSASDSNVDRVYPDALHLFYAVLSPVLKCSFLFCGIFPEDCSIPRRKLLRLMVAEGLADQETNQSKTKEEYAEDQLKQLVHASMLEEEKASGSGEVAFYRMHDVLHELSQAQQKKEEFWKVLPEGGESDDATTRRLSGANGVTIASSQLSSKKIRSFVLGGGSIQKLPMLMKQKWLRVLDLQGMRINEPLPEALGNLILLRYLGLRGTGIRKLPTSLVKLTSLETLDIRQTDVQKLQSLHLLTRLRHLLMGKSLEGRVVNLSGQIQLLTELQTIAGAQLAGDLCEALGGLIQLRKLSVGRAKGGVFSQKLAESISKMTVLRSLTIKCQWGEALDLNTLEGRFPPLNKLKLGGRINNVLEWVCSLHSLRTLHLWDTKLRDDPLSASTKKKDPLSALQVLKNLVVLCLDNAFEGTHIECSEGGFPSLNMLSIVHSWELDFVGIARGSMQKLKEMCFAYCPNLQEAPEGIEHLKDLQVVRITEMPSNFKEKLEAKKNEPSERKIWFKVNDIPAIRSDY